MSDTERFLSFTAVERSLDAAESALVSAFEQVNFRFTRSLAETNVNHLYLQHPPLGGAHMKALMLYSPRLKPSLSVVMTNLTDGWNSLSYILARRHQRFQIQVTSTQSDVRYPKHMIQVWQDGEPRRVIMVMRDSDQWKFFEEGELQSFEDAGVYANRNVSKRLDRLIVNDILRKIGIDTSNEAFWRSDLPAIYFNENRSSPTLD